MFSSFFNHRPDNAVDGDVLVLTKPLGTQVAVNLHQWMTDPEKWSNYSSILTESEAEKSYQRAMASMARLNLIGMFNHIRLAVTRSYLKSKCFRSITQRRVVWN